MHLKLSGTSGLPARAPGLLAVVLPGPLPCTGLQFSSDASARQILVSPDLRADAPLFHLSLLYITVQ